MKILVHLAPFYGRLTGIGRYTLNILRRLLGREEIEAVYGLALSGICPPDRLRKLLASIEIDSPRRKMESGLIHRLRTAAGSLPYAFTLVRTFQSWRLRSLKGDFIYWEPSYVLLPYRGAAVVTIHDLSHFRHPECHPPERRRWLEENLPKSLERADHIVVVSEFTRRELLDVYRPQRPITVVPPGVERRFRPYSKEEVRPALKRYGLDWKNYLLAVGTLEPRKNLERLLVAFSKLPHALRCRFPLVLIGTRGWGNRSLEDLMSKLTASGEVRWLGYVPQRDLPHLYAGARLLAYPSLYEGFGMPVIEAMACGTPVLTSNRSALPETSGGAAYLVDPESIEEIGEGLQALLEREMAQKLREKGLSRAAQFRWSEAAAKMVGCFRAIERQK